MINLEEEIRTYHKQKQDLMNKIINNYYIPSISEIDPLFGREDLSEKEKSTIQIGSTWYSIFGENLFKSYKTNQ